MSKSNTFENALLKLIFQAVAIPGLAENDASSPVTNLSVALHTADPGEAGDQSTNEIAYTGYARIDVIRTSSGWTVTGNIVNPAANIEFGLMTGGAGGTATHASVGTGVSNEMLYKGALSPTLVIVTGKVPRLTTATAISEE